MDYNEKNKKIKYVFRTRYSIVLVLLFSLIIFFLMYEYFEEKTLDLLVISLIFFLVLVILAGIRYIILGNDLIFMLWFVKTGEIKIDSITDIVRTYNPLASNAASFKRLECSLKKGNKYPFILISPVNEEKFIEIIKNMNPKIEIEVENKKGYFRFWDWDI